MPAALVATSTTPGVDQAVITGIRYRFDRTSVVTAMPKHRAATQEALCADVAPSTRAASTTSNMVLANPTMTVVNAAMIVGL